MKPHHEFVHAYDTARTYNWVVETIDKVLASIVNEDVNGFPLNETLENLKTLIVTYCNKGKWIYARIDKFLAGHEIYDLTQWTNKSRPNVIADKLLADKLNTDVPTAVTNVSITKLDKLIALASQFTNPLVYVTPIIMQTEYHNVIILNDWLDHISYTCKGIDSATGQPHTKTDEQVRTIARGCLGQFGNFTGYSYGSALQTEVNLMVDVKDQVMSVVDSAPLLDIAAMIDTQVVKLPLMRRVWALG